MQVTVYVLLQYLTGKLCVSKLHDIVARNTGKN